ncbi:hypothetical protein [Cupriavidus necator]|uniref:hypothetical protein n=1 Tax=Cupriavidus necator TaxID=106590 RepID=UPI0005B494DE|nr:hypothetical protein [Cupriavidus necator]
MKERPILFSGAMVRAILDGRKTQTRRVVKESHLAHTRYVPDGAGDVFVHDTYRCPYGLSGDRLWVRETWSTDFANHYPHDRVWYAADDDRRHDIEVRDGVRGIYSPESGVHVPFRWRPSIHMPRWACRIELEITGVRGERLNDCSEEDALAEGVTLQPCHPRHAERMGRDAYEKLWDSINGAGAWDANPWVWVVEFWRVQR